SLERQSGGRSRAHHQHEQREADDLFARSCAPRRYRTEQYGRIRQRRRSGTGDQGQRRDLGRGAAAEPGDTRHHALAGFLGVRFRSSIFRSSIFRSSMKAARAAGLLLLTLSGAVFIFVFICTFEVFAGEPVAVKIRDLTSVEGVRENPLIGYGMVVGLTQTGDSQQTVFTTQTLA